MSPRTLWRGWLLALGLGSVALALWRPPVPSQSAAAVPEPAGELAPPALPRRDLPVEVMLAQAQELPWGVQAKPKAANEAGEAAQGPAWRVVGALMGPKGPRVALQFEQDPATLRYLAEGENLPDGRRLRRIERTRALVFDPASKKEVWMGLSDIAFGGKQS